MSYAEQLAEFIQKHPRLVVLTGAGVSTDSGIPAYRDKEGNWQHSAPVKHQSFMSSEYARQRFWARSMVGWPVIRDANPCDAHYSLASLETMGHIELLVTQNVDRLHQKAGSKLVVDLHGRSDKVICMNCGNDYSRDSVHHLSSKLNPNLSFGSAAVRPDGDADLEDDQINHFNVPSCANCDGILKPDVVYFGDNVPKDIVFSILDTLQQADALLTVGSSLMVYSGYRFCKKARQWDKPVASLNLGMTRADPILDLKISAHIGRTLKQTIELLDKTYN